MKRLLYVALILPLSGLADNPFLPPPVRETGGGSPSENQIAQSDADEVALMERIKRGELVFKGRVNHYDVYFDQILKEYLYINTNDGK